ncbi:DUF192 domain-containing protein [Virgibacillus xinjiangensis]|uniref:DUF192 domain-containing protein n=1 Tax=Virgibacillus xinjiangensis TaxID=393090 RepID=A0ABV7CYT9_9BACI
MRNIRLINKETGEIIAREVRVADRFWSRLKGLMFTKNMQESTGLHITPCASIHTFFMNYSIDILYLNREKEIVGIEENLEKGKIGKRFKQVRSVIELPAGTIKNTSTAIGQTVALVHSDHRNAEQKDII